MKKVNALEGMLTSLGWLEDRSWCWGVVSDRSRKSSVDLPGRASDVRARVAETREAAEMMRQTELTAVFWWTHTGEPETGRMLPDIKPQNSSQVPSDGETKAVHAQGYIIPKAGPGYEL